MQECLVKFQDSLSDNFTVEVGLSSLVFADVCF